ncbi:hypothetical protein Y032_0163g3494 [Ancylostoma ceylanicum]|uniref:Uncharacterized protein n=1 Tax=Ancylostoma ceylanicum TaxID=53326 RepID=A0A016SXR5_9BILA|nr:hypothetical protein Y032_0163g3494 [Ancylostoma ceylanicum]
MDHVGADDSTVGIPSGAESGVLLIAQHPNSKASINVEDARLAPELMGGVVLLRENNQSDPLPLSEMLWVWENHHD